MEQSKTGPDSHKLKADKSCLQSGFAHLQPVGKGVTDRLRSQCSTQMLPFPAPSSACR